MVIMDTYYPPNRLQEIWQTIDQLHLSYLEMEESPEKLDHRIRLEECIREFLCMASHSQKFVLRATGDVLFRSAATKKDFSGYKAATGWNAIQMYAGNLLTQPWRKEYRQIKTYCGFYKHQIEANLVGAELMFEVMGYKHHSNGILVLEGPVCPDRVTSVSKDCLIAYVECQILKAIWEELASSFKISWLEVLEFRQTHICSPEQCIRALTYQFHEKQFQTQNCDLYSRCHQTNAAPAVQYPPMAAHAHALPPNIPPIPYLYGTNSCCPNPYATYTHVPYSVPVQFSQHVIKPNYGNGYYCTNGFLGQQHAAYGYTVPTAQLIELDSHQNGTYDVVDHPTNSLRVRRNSSNSRDIKKNNETKVSNVNKEIKEESHFEDWDYVYRNLESQGYSKDLGERGDILSPTANQKKAKATNLDEAMHNLNITDRPLKIPEHIDQFNESEIRKNIERNADQGSSYDNLSYKKPIVSKTEKRKNVPSKEKTNHNNNNVYEVPHKVDSQKSESTKWECKVCTYHNDNYKNICEMCSKSRSTVEQQMEIGGPQCSKCTLVNSKDAKVCQACDASLKDSPTYI